MVARRHSKKNPDVLLSSGSFFTFPWRFLRHCRRPTNDLAFLRRAPLHRFASRLLFIYPGTNGRRTADVGGQRRRTTLLVPHKRDTRISILALARFGLSSLLLRTTVVKEIRREACPERTLWNTVHLDPIRGVFPNLIGYFAVGSSCRGSYVSNEIQLTKSCASSLRIDRGCLEFDAEFVPY